MRMVAGLIGKASVSALAVSLAVSRADFSGVRESLAVAPAPGLALAFAAFLLIMALGGLRWWLALRGIGERARLGHAMALFSAAAMAGQVMPLVASDGVRIWLAARDGCSMRSAIHSVLLERVFMVLALLALALATAPLFAARTGYGAPIWLSAGLLTGGIAIFAVLLFADRAPRGIAQMRPWGCLSGAAAPARRLVLSQWGAYLAAVSVLSNLAIAFAAFLLGRALDLQLTTWDLLAIMPAVTLAAALPVSLGGWGVREGLLVLLLGRMGVPAADALALSLLFGVTSLLSGLPGLLATVFRSLWSGWAVPVESRGHAGSGR